jgi:hypothetical protein
MAGKLTISTLNDSSGVLATQNGMTGISKAWVQYSTTTIASSFNVSSITANATGDYTINFTTAMPNTNYGVTACYGDTTAGAVGQGLRGIQIYSVAVGSVRVTQQSNAGTGYTGNLCSVSVFSS